MGMIPPCTVDRLSMQGLSRLLVPTLLYDTPDIPWLHVAQLLVAALPDLQTACGCLVQLTDW
jgi:hypothetical protein